MKGIRRPRGNAIRAVGNFVSVYRFQADRIGLLRNWVESRSNLAPGANAPLFQQSSGRDRFADCGTSGNSSIVYIDDRKQFLSFTLQYLTVRAVSLATK